MSELKTILEAKKEKKSTKMLPELHALDDKIEAFIQKLENKINSYKGENPVFVRKAHQMLGDMSKEYSEFLAALRAIVNACDRKGLVLPKEKAFSKVRDINSKKGKYDDQNDQTPEDGGEEEAEAPLEKGGVKEALEMEPKKKITKNDKLSEYVMGSKQRYSKIKDVEKYMGKLTGKEFGKYREKIKKTGFDNISDKELDRLWLKVRKA